MTVDQLVVLLEQRAEEVERDLEHLFPTPPYHPEAQATAELAREQTLTTDDYRARSAQQDTVRRVREEATALRLAARALRILKRIGALRRDVPAGPARAAAYVRTIEDVERLLNELQALCG